MSVSPPKSPSLRELIAKTKSKDYEESRAACNPKLQTPQDNIKQTTTCRSSTQEEELEKESSEDGEMTTLATLKVEKANLLVQIGQKIDSYLQMQGRNLVIYNSSNEDTDSSSGSTGDDNEKDDGHNRKKKRRAQDQHVTNEFENSPRTTDNNLFHISAQVRIEASTLYEEALNLDADVARTDAIASCIFTPPLGDYREHAEHSMSADISNDGRPALGDAGDDDSDDEDDDEISDERQLQHMFCLSLNEYTSHLKRCPNDVKTIRRLVSMLSSRIEEVENV